MKLKPFRAVRPVPDCASKVAALPYDVMNSDEARVMVQGNPLSFLHVDKAEIDLDPGIDPYDSAVYDKAAENLAKLKSDGAMTQDDTPCFYLYRLTMGKHVQTGFVGCPSVDDYISEKIKKHELTRAAKEADRIRHVDRLDANTGPIFLASRPAPSIAKLKNDWISSHDPIYDFIADEDVRHQAWVIDDEKTISEIEAAFDSLPALYIADGHHRCASAVRVAEMRRKAAPGFTGTEEFNYFLAVVFPSDELAIMDYNRVVTDLGGLSGEEFLAKVAEVFEVSELAAGSPPAKPTALHQFGMFLNDKWYLLKAKPGTWDDKDTVGKLDVAILQDKLLAPILGIEDPRSDKRIDFVGGIRGLEELERRVHEDMTVAFALYPTSMDQLMDIADAGLIMPPKSTWFEPKLLSGLFIHELS